MSLSYKSKLLVYFTVLFAAFTLVLFVFQQNRERQHRRAQLESRLRSYADIVAGAVEEQGGSTDSTTLVRTTRLFPKDLRVTVIETDGTVHYETSEAATTHMENHRFRPEVVKAYREKEGSDIRVSATTGDRFFYYAKSYDDFLVRVALPYDTSVKLFMQTDHVLLWFALMLFPVLLVLIIQVADRFGKSVAGLRSFINSAERGLVDYGHIVLPHSELGDIGRAIVEKYRQLEESKQQTELERERLIRHFHYFEEGIAIFSPDRSKLYTNPRFIQYVNTILDHPTADIDALWEHPLFAPALEFVRANAGRQRTLAEETPVCRFTIPATASSAYFAVQLLVYVDGGFEMTLSDITRAEKNRLLKQQMSNNITHELRTPVSSIRGYLETLLNFQTIDPERRTYFLERAHAQSVRLADLIRDVSLITKVDEAPDTLPRERLHPRRIFEEIIEEFSDRIAACGMKVRNGLADGLVLQGNYSLIYSVFRNLMENSLRYAGEGALVCAECYNEDAEFCYFSFYDTGSGVPEEHLPRLFERFYRVSEGRTRDCGGTGLGLSIVRNAVLFHQGTISVRNRKEGGLEFLFTLKK